MFGAGAMATTAALVLGNTSFTAQAFTPIRPYAAILGNSTSHTSMTDTAVEALDQEYFGVAELTETMKKARNEIHDANAEMDETANQQPKNHFDSEALLAANQRLIDESKAVKTALDAKDATTARKHLGGALHTLQDFYAHTNWIDLGNGSPNTALGRPGAKIGDIAGPLDKVCAPGDAGKLIGRAAKGAAEPLLTSGYYKEEKVDKCRHGGVMDSGSRFHGINKDARAPLTSPDGHLLHDKAAAVATEATKEWVRNAVVLQHKLTDAQVAALFGYGPSLGFAIDTTGSMGGIIASVKAEAIGLVDSRLDTRDEPRQYVLSPFNDPGVGPLTVTDNPDDFKAAISSLSASGGGDCPEFSMAGQLAAVSAMDEGGTLFAYTDADAKDAYLAGLVAAAAKANKITVYQMMFGSCSGAFSAPATGRSATRTGQEPAAAPKSSAAGGSAREDVAAAAVAEENPYVRIARETGGQVFHLGYGDAGVITKLADAVVRSDTVDVLSQTAPLTGTATDIAVPVDSHLGSVTFAVSSSGSLGLKVLRPDGTTVTPADAGVTILSPSTGTTQVVTVNKPAAGPWKLRLTGSGVATVTVRGSSDLSLEFANFVAPSDVSGDADTDYQGPIDGAPVAGRTTGLDAGLGDGYAGAAFELRRPNGSVISKLALNKAESEFFGTFTVPSEPFRVFVTGKDDKGKPFVRVRSDLVTPTTLTVTAPPVGEIPAGTATTVEFGVHNYGPAGSFTPAALDEKGYVTSVSPSTLDLAAGADGKVSVTLQPPAGLTGDGLSDSLTVTVTRADDPSVSNYAVASFGIFTKDVTPPVTVPTPDPAVGARGWATADTTLTLKATDDHSGVASLSYSVSGKQRVKTTTVNGDTATIRITKEGVSTVRFQAIDKDGNVEEPQTYEIKLDKTAPSLSCSTKPQRLRTIDTGLVPISAIVRVRDKLSGPEGFTLKSVSDNQGSAAADIVGWELGRSDSQGQLRATQLRGSDRVYTLTYEGTDVAGNVGTCSAMVMVDHRIV